MRLQLEREHQSLAAHVGHLLVACGNLPQAVLHHGSDPSRVLDQALVEEVQRGEPRRASDRVAAERAAVGSGRPVHLLGPRDERSERETRRDALGQTDDVGLHVPVLDGEQLSGPAHARLHLVDHHQDAMLECELAQPRQEIVRRDQVAALALDRLDEDRRHALGRGDRRKQLLDALHGLVGGHATGGRREGRVKHRRQQRREPPSLACLRRSQRQGAERPAVEGADERDVARPAAGEARELHRALDRLRAGVGEEHLGRRTGQDLRLQALGQLDLRAVVKVGAGHVDEAPGLLLDRGHDFGVGVTGRDDGDACREVQEPVAVDVCHPAALAPFHDKGIGAGEAG